MWALTRFLSSFLFFLSFNLLLPELPDHLTRLGGGEYKGYIIALFTLTAGLSRPFTGKLAEPSPKCSGCEEEAHSYFRSCPKQSSRSFQRPVIVIMKKLIPALANDREALQAARQAYAEASAKKRYATARLLTGMSGAERVSVLKAAKQLVRMVAKPSDSNTISLVRKQF